MNEDLNPNFTGNGIYRENIIDHYKNPHNHGSIVGASIVHSENNPLCGDIINVYLKIKKDVVEDIKFIGNGCAISQSAMSMLTDDIMGKTIEEIKKIKREDIVSMLNIPIGPVRTKCAVLGLVAVKEAIKEYEKKSDKK